MDKIRQFITNFTYDMEGFFKNLEFSDKEKKISLYIGAFFAFCLLAWIICFALFFETAQTIFGYATIVGLVGLIGWAIGLLIFKKMKG